MKKLFFFVIILLTSLNLFAQESSLKAIALNYKIRHVKENLDLNFDYLLPKSNAEHTIIVGVPWDAVQPVGIFQNISNQTLTFKVKCTIYNDDLKKLIYSINTTVSDECLRLKDDDTIYCGDNPYIKVRYCSVTEKDGIFATEYLPYPGNNNLKGIPPGGFVEVHFSPFEPNDYFAHHFGNCTISVTTIPIVPETGDTLKEKDFSDDTLKFPLLLRKKKCAELYYPLDGDTVTSENNIFCALTSATSINIKQLEFSKSANFENIDLTSTNLTSNNLKFEKGSSYFWRLNVQQADSNCISEARKFYVDNETSISEDTYLETRISPNPTSDYITLNIPPLEKRGPGGVLEPIRIFDVFGNCVLNVGAIHELPLRIDISTLPPGVYFVRIGNEKPMKFMVVR